MSLSVRTFGKYLLDEEIARGGMSRVYSARLRGLGGFEKRLVVKQVLPELARDPRFVSMFVTEAKTLVQMSHPNIAPVYELGVVDGIYFLAMEMIEGATLSRILRGGQLDAASCAHVGAEIADALHYAHTRFEIVHRDVTPRNVMIDGNGHCKLLDFGVAAPADTGDDQEVFGTPGYMSPEHLKGTVAPSADVFSLGAILFKALTGRRAFPARTVDENRTLLENEELPAFDESDTERVPSELQAIVMRAIALDPVERYSSAREVARALRSWLAKNTSEDVRPELGARAERTEARRSQVNAIPDEEGVNTPAEPSEVKSLATSSLLRDLLMEDDGEARKRTDPSTPPRLDEPGTQPIERVLKEPVDDEDEPHTAAIPERQRAKAVQAEPAPSHLGWVALVGVLLVVGVGVVVWASNETTEAIDDPVIANGPDDTVNDPNPDPGNDDRVLDVDEVPLVDPDNVDPDNVDPDNAVPENGDPAGTGVGVTPDPPDEPVPPTPRVVARGSLTVSARPWAEVRLDGRLLGQTPQRRIAVTAGTHRLELRCPPLGSRVATSFEASGGRAISVHADLEADPPTIVVR